MMLKHSVVVAALVLEYQVVAVEVTLVTVFVDDESAVAAEAVVGAAVAVVAAQPAYVVADGTLAAVEVPRVLGVLVCGVLEVEVEPAAVNAAVVPIGAVVAAVAVAAVDVAATAAGVAVLGEEVEHPKVVEGQSAVQLAAVASDW
jgi:Na+-translocating ferredoxin:NAD+ oxidoreductase RnfD subunit